MLRIGEWRVKSGEWRVEKKNLYVLKAARQGEGPAVARKAERYLTTEEERQQALGIRQQATGKRKILDIRYSILDT